MLPRSDFNARQNNSNIQKAIGIQCRISEALHRGTPSLAAAALRRSATLSAGLFLPATPSLLCGSAPRFDCQCSLDRNDI